MSFTIKTTTEAKEVANFISFSILEKLKLNKKVLFFVTGGSSIAVGVKVAQILKNDLYKSLIHNLTITLTDERYGPIDHIDSNWHQLVEKGFSLPLAKLIPVLTGDTIKVTTEKFNSVLNDEFRKIKENEYRIGLFGIGTDGHTAGILPESEALNSLNWATQYNTPTFSRITITPKTIMDLDEAVVWAQGKDKWPVLENLEKNIPARNASHNEVGGDIIKQPAQILKKVPLLTIFTDYNK